MAGIWRFIKIPPLKGGFLTAFNFLLYINMYMVLASVTKVVAIILIASATLSANVASLVLVFLSYFDSDFDIFGIQPNLIGLIPFLSLFLWVPAARFLKSGKIYTGSIFLLLPLIINWFIVLLIVAASGNL